MKSLLIFILLLLSFYANSQESYTVQILHAETGNMQVKNGETIRKLIGNVALKHKKSYFYSDSAIIYPNNNIEGMGRVKIRNGKSTTIWGDKVDYFSEQELSIIKGNAIVEKDKSKLYTDAITYNLADEVGYYMTGGKLVTDSSVITSKQGTYYAKESLVIFKNDVKVKHPDYKLQSDSLKYDTKSKRTIFTHRTKIETDSGYIWCNSGWYDEENKVSSFGYKTLIVNPPQWILTDSIYMDDNTKINYLFKEYAMHDTSAKFHIYGDTAVIFQATNEFKAYHRPMLKIDGEDSSKHTYIKAETIESFQNNDDKTLIATGLVRVYNVDYQSVSGYLKYTTTDSLLRLREDPIMWTDSDQILGDTIDVQMENKSPSEISVWKNAMLVQKEVSDIFNQISADSIEINFQYKQIHNLRARNNAKSIYYGEEEGKGYLGLNSSESKNLKAEFWDGKVDKITFYENPIATFYPMKDINAENKFLDNFVWKIELRPKSKYDLD